jgi:hypothetical protein
MCRSRLSKRVVWRWQQRFMHEGVMGLLCDKTHKLGKAPLPPEFVKCVVDYTLSVAASCAPRRGLMLRGAPRHSMSCDGSASCDLEQAVNEDISRLKITDWDME